MKTPTSGTAPGILLLLGAIALAFMPPLGVVLLALGALILVMRLASSAFSSTEKTKSCPACSRTVGSEAMFCHHCGKPFPTA